MHGRDIGFSDAVLTAVVADLMKEGLKARIDAETPEAVGEEPVAVPTVSVLFHEFVEWVAERALVAFDSSKLRIIRDVWTSNIPPWELAIAKDPPTQERPAPAKKTTQETEVDNSNQADGSDSNSKSKAKSKDPVFKIPTSVGYKAWRAALNNFLDMLPAATCNQGTPVYNWLV